MYRSSVVFAWALGIALIVWRTEGLHVVSTEGARRSAVARTPQVLSDWVIEVNGPGERRLSALSSETTLLLNFIYTRCPTVCREQGSRFTQLQQRLTAAERTDVKLLSVTIDPGRDSHEQLAAYRTLHKGSEVNWWVARAQDVDQLRRIKDELGLRVIDDGWGGFAHSEALHAIRGGQLVAILDWDSPRILESLQ